MNYGLFYWLIYIEYLNLLKRSQNIDVGFVLYFFNVKLKGGILFFKWIKI